MPEIPTISRRVWYWPQATDRGPIDPDQPFDAGVVYVDPDSPDTHLCTLVVTDHYGYQFIKEQVRVIDDRRPGYAQWMPYQQKKHAQEAKVGQQATPAQQAQAQDQRVTDGTMTPTKVTIEMIEAQIIGEHTFTIGAALDSMGQVKVGHAAFGGMEKVTVCVLVLRNGTKIVGVNYGAIDDANHSAEQGRQSAREAAIEQMWPMLGYELRTKMRPRG